jgi:hypothetical protein
VHVYITQLAGAIFRFFVTLAASRCCCHGDDSTKWVPRQQFHPGTFLFLEKHTLGKSRGSSGRVMRLEFAPRKFLNFLLRQKGLLVKVEAGKTCLQLGESEESFYIFPSNTIANQSHKSRYSPADRFIDIGS